MTTGLPTYDEWELQVFNSRVNFRVIKWLGGGKKIIVDFPADQLEKAMEETLSYKGEYGHGATLYATAGAPGWHSICLDRKDWPKWLKIYNSQK